MATSIPYLLHYNILKYNPLYNVVLLQTTTLLFNEIIRNKKILSENKCK